MSGGPVSSGAPEEERVPHEGGIPVTGAPPDGSGITDTDDAPGTGGAPKIIASTYEIIKEIGEGGGGKVYLGRHLNLDKQIVLKADKRTGVAPDAETGTSTRSRTVTPEVLRREVDALKNLSHMYIPQVYDYVEQDGVVYTVMDYIEGESFDKPLKEGVRFPQARIVEWACELLEALCYLHSRPPYGILHSDIKPANIMLTPQGDIRLIDFNIALALGEEGAVRVGRSQGYASPEHYGVDFTGFSGPGTERTRTARTRDAARTRDSSVRVSSSVGTSGSHTVMLDVRSDIYSLGATLYHFLTGQRPARRAQDVIPITEFKDRNISPLIAQIITKAMHPNPNLRYQTAKEMLWAFEHLHERDPRARRRRRRIACTALFSVGVLALGGLLTFVGLRQQERLNGNLTAAAASREALQAGNVDLAVSEALKALPPNPDWLDPPYTPEAQRALANALGVYDLSDGYKPHKLIELKSPDTGNPVNPKKACLSPDGSMAAVLVNELENWWIYVYDTDSGNAITTEPLKAAPTAWADFVFTERGALLYAGENGLTSYNLTTRSQEWSTGRPATKIALSGDESTVATVSRDESSAALWNAVSGESLGAEVDFQGRSMPVLADDWAMETPYATIFSLSATGDWLAVSFDDGSVSLYYLPERTEIAIFDAGDTDCTRFEGGFYRSFFSIAAYGGSNSYFMILRLEDAYPLHIAEDTRAFHVQTDADGIYLYRPAWNAVSQLNPYAESDEGFIVRTIAETETKMTAFRKRGNRTLATCADGTWLVFDENAETIRQFSGAAPGSGGDFYAATADAAGDFYMAINQDAASLTIQRWERQPPADGDFSYDRSIFHLEANVHSDGETAVLFWREKCSVINQNGDVLAAFDLPDTGKLYDQQYRRPGETDRLGKPVTEDYLELWYNDGFVRGYSVKNGEALFAEQGPTPESVGTSGTRQEEILETEHYRVVSALNSTPELYDKESGKHIASLNADGNLMYIYETQDGLIAQYMEGNSPPYTRFGTLLDKDGRVIADLPRFTDALPDGALVFDDTIGNLRRSRIYSIQSLIDLGQRYKEVNQ